jgi:cytochrome c1
MFKKLTLSAAVAVGLASSAMGAGGGGGYVEDIDFSFDGMFGSYDQNQLQRGLQVYTEICAAWQMKVALRCPKIKYVHMQNRSKFGMHPLTTVKAITGQRHLPTSIQKTILLTHLTFH